MSPQQVQSWQLRDPSQACENCPGDKEKVQAEVV